MDTTPAETTTAATDDSTDTSGTTHPLDFLVNDPSGKPALCDEQLFATILAELVADSAPRIFAIVQEYGERVDAHIAAWGMAFDDHADVISDDHHTRLSLRTPEQALRHFRFGSHIHSRLVYYDTDATTELRADVTQECE